MCLYITNYPPVTQAGNSVVGAQPCQKGPEIIWSQAGASNPGITMVWLHEPSQEVKGRNHPLLIKPHLEQCPDFGPLNGRKMLIKLKDVNESEARFINRVQSSRSGRGSEKVHRVSWINPLGPWKCWNLLESGTADFSQFKCHSTLTLRHLQKSKISFPIIPALPVVFELLFQTLMLNQHSLEFQEKFL